MDFKTQTNQQPSSAQGKPSVNEVKKSPVRKITAALIVVVLVVVSVLAGVLVGSSSDKSSASVEKDKYQAVFMTNGQVYFGKLAGLDGNYPELTDVYYLQVQQQNIQPGTGGNATQTENGEQPQVSLTKLGNELHGPTDRMHIASDQILFWENLKDDSTVVKAIKDYQDKQ